MWNKLTLTVLFHCRQSALFFWAHHDCQNRAECCAWTVTPIIIVRVWKCDNACSPMLFLHIRAWFLQLASLAPKWVAPAWFDTVATPSINYGKSLSIVSSDILHQFQLPFGRTFFVVPSSWFLPSRYVPLTSFSTVPACIICLRHYHAFSSRLLCSIHPRFNFDRPIEPLDTTRCLQQILSRPICKLATNQHNLHRDWYVRCIVVDFRLANGAKSKIIRLIVVIIHTIQAVH